MRSLVLLRFGRFPQVQVVRALDFHAVLAHDDADAWAVGVWSVSTHDNRNLTRIEPHEIARWINADELREPADQVLIELLAVVPLQHREDAVCRKRLLIRALRSHRVVDI